MSDSCFNCHNMYNKGKNDHRKKQILHQLSILGAEFFGTLILVFVTCMGCNEIITGSKILPLQRALTSGLAVLIVIHIFGHISYAHVNPMTSLCALVLNEISFKMFPLYALSQVIGGLVGYGLVSAVTPKYHMQAQNGTQSDFCMTLPSDQLTSGQAIGVELLITAILAFSNCSAWDIRNTMRTDSLAIRFGFIVSTICMIANPYTGASMNPARSFAPALWNNNWRQHWIYWIGPLASGLITSLIYKIIFKDKSKQYLEDSSS